MEPAYVDAIVESVARACATLSSPESESVSVLGTAHVVFTAHSLPVAATGAGDPYQSQLRETAVLVAERTGLDQDGWTLAFQGAVGHTERWLGPAVEDVLASLSSRGVRRVVLCPFGFVLDQVEILYDIDVALRGRARELGMELVRTPTLNDSAPLVEVLAGLVEGWEAAAEKGRLA
jgi:ferrochelatase